MNYALIRTGGKQYRVAAGDTLEIEKIAGEPGAAVEFEDVLMTALDGTVRVGTPTVAGAKVIAQVLAQGKAKKILVFKKKRRKKYRRRYGHRQPLTRVRIENVEVAGGGDGA